MSSSDHKLESIEIHAITKKGFTWAEWSIIIAIVVIVIAFCLCCYAYAVVAEAQKEQRKVLADLVVAQGKTGCGSSRIRCD